MPRNSIRASCLPFLTKSRSRPCSAAPTCSPRCWRTRWVAKAKGVTLDLAFRTPGAWLLVEVQRDLDEDKRSMWPFALALLHRQTRQMGDLVVITQDRAVARWSKRVEVASKSGTRLSVEPVVLLLDEAMANRLLDQGKPELAFFAAWAMQRRRGPRALAIVERALEISHGLPAGLREEEQHAILDVLNERLVSRLKEHLMKSKTLPRSKAVTDFLNDFKALGKVEGKAEGKAEGKLEGQREMLLKLLGLKGIKVPATQQKRIQKCTDPEQLETWAGRVLTATTLKDVLG